MWAQCCTDSAQICATSDLCWPDFDQLRPIATTFGRPRPHSGRFRPKPRHSWAEFRLQPGFELGRIWARFDQFWPDFDQVLPVSTKIRSYSCDGPLVDNTPNLNSYDCLENYSRGGLGRRRRDSQKHRQTYICVAPVLGLADAPNGLRSYSKDTPTLLSAALVLGKAPKILPNVTRTLLNMTLHRASPWTDGPNMLQYNLWVIFARRPLHSATMSPKLGPELANIGPNWPDVDRILWPAREDFATNVVDYVRGVCPGIGAAESNLRGCFRGVCPGTRTAESVFWSTVLVLSRGLRRPPRE